MNVFNKIKPNEVPLSLKGMKEAFLTFFKIGIVTFGGGYAMIPMIEEEVVNYAMIPMIEEEVVNKHHWTDKEELLDLIAIAQSCPGVFAINISTFIGYKLNKKTGALCTTLGAALPSFIIILLIAMFFHQFADNKVIAAMFRGIRPAVVALIAAPTFRLAKTANISLTNCWIPIACALAIWALGVSPILIIVVAAVAGYVYGQFIKPTE